MCTIHTDGGNKRENGSGTDKLGKHSQAESHLSDGGATVVTCIDERVNGHDVSVDESNSLGLSEIFCTEPQGLVVDSRDEDDAHADQELVLDVRIPRPRDLCESDC